MCGTTRCHSPNASFERRRYKSRTAFFVSNEHLPVPQIFHGRCGRNSAHKVRASWNRFLSCTSSACQARARILRDRVHPTRSLPRRVWDDYSRPALYRFLCADKSRPRARRSPRAETSHRKPAGIVRAPLTVYHRWQVPWPSGHSLAPFAPFSVSAFPKFYFLLSNFPGSR